MARHTVEASIISTDSNKKNEFTSRYLSYMQLNKEIINKLNGKTHLDWHLKIGDDERLPYATNINAEKYIDLIFESEEFINDGWSNIKLNNARLTKKEEEDDVLFKKWLQNKIDTIQVDFTSYLSLDANLANIDFDISGEKDSQFFFWLVKLLFEYFSNDIKFFNVTQTSGNTDLHCIFPDRREISWMQLIKAELLAEDVPSAYAVWYMPNIGSVVISTQEVFSNESKQHRDTAHAIEQELHKIGLLPLIKGSSDLGFIGREEWRKNMGLTN
ncbi:Imm52 family immunity protein [Janthinobacterium sp. B9-8]|uniref:Imm52 family immunity protein n=1 Tax=Janthinobacterium sp. B9-8 TaxID=1236179 RepID=UPI00061CFCDE|nr:Imm52 family immunity protein [Janthinobacterium sp. B9-8]AMC35307.1 hypothetical protein VN23_12155 [Janthinobacterium sp. B9-8]